MVFASCIFKILLQLILLIELLEIRAPVDTSISLDLISFVRFIRLIDGVGISPSLLLSQSVKTRNSANV